MMTWYSYLYMLIVWGIITGLNIYCFYRVFSSKNIIAHDEDEDNNN